MLLERLGIRQHDERRQPQSGTQPTSLGGAGEIRHSLRKFVVRLPVPDGAFPTVVDLDGVESEPGELNHDLVQSAARNVLVERVPGGPDLSGFLIDDPVAGGE